jgi:sialic acid synthase SpsE
MFEKYTSENPYIMAEIGVNHEGNLDTAKLMIEQIAIAGAHCAKFQSYKAEKLAARNSPAYWDLSEEKTKTQYELFQKFDSFEVSDYQMLSDCCNKLNIDFLSTGFDLDAIEMLKPLQDFYKIASADLTNYPLLRSVASKKKPVVMSTGASTLEEIKQSITLLEKFGAEEIVLLHCVLNYPTPYENANLEMIKTLRKEFSDIQIGYSDHIIADTSHSALIQALEYGATVLEKHYSQDKTLSGNDHYHAMDFDDLKSFVQLLSNRKKMKGTGIKEMKLEQSAILHARRSIYYSKSMSAGSILTETDIISKRPGHGISPMHWESIIGKTLLNDVQSDKALQWSDFSSTK